MRVGSGQCLDRIDKESTALPMLQNRLAQVRQSLHDGPGIAILRGLKPTCVSMKQNIAIFAGLSSHVSSQRVIQSGGKIIGKCRFGRNAEQDGPVIERGDVN
ncbi:hypothetical protein RRF57_009596 [Xylaria bambusicola]|uniref:Uncharacterized protein n=1 Tax=Xylaria bambusicola TaxID=326684 RepID=A0AAN7UR63_9PEZI